MTQENKTHWRKLHNPDYFGAYCLLPGQEITVTIKSVGLESVTGQGGSKEQCTVTRFTDSNIKPLILNVVNQKTIQKVYGTPYIEDWVGKSIIIYHTMEKAFGEMMEVVRIRPKKPTTIKPKFTPDDKNWSKAVQAIASGAGTIKSLKEKFELSEDDENRLLSEAM